MKKADSPMAIHVLYKMHPQDEYKCSCGSTRLRRLKKGETARDYVVRCQDCWCRWHIQKGCVHCGITEDMYNGREVVRLRTDGPWASMLVCTRCLREIHNLARRRLVAGPPKEKTWPDGTVVKIHPWKHVLEPWS